MRIGRAFELAAKPILATLLAAGTLGCDDPETGTALRPEGPPEILQVFVSEEGGTLDTFIQVNDSLIDDDMSNCPDDYEEAGLDCAVTAATPLNTRVRVITDELLRGDSVEEFFC